MSALDGMTLWTGDYLADTTHLTTAQHGAYLLILIAMWRAPEGRLRNDEHLLARIAKLPIRNWRQMRDQIMVLLLVDGDWVTQKRLQWERKNTLQRISKNKASGKAGGEAKALKDKERALANATFSPQQNCSDPMALGSGSGSGEEKKDAAKAAVQEGLFGPTPEELNKQLFDRGKQVLGKEAGGFVSKLLRSQHGNVATARAVLETAATKQDPREYIGAVIRGKSAVTFTKERQAVLP